MCGIAHLLDNCLVLHIAENLVDKLYDSLHILLYQTSGSDGGSSYADTGSSERSTAVERNHVLVDGDVSTHEGLLGHLTCQIRELGAEVNQHQVVVSTAGHNLVASVDECLSHGCRILLHLHLVLLELRLQSLVERYSLGTDAVLERTALYAREYSRVDQLGHHLDLAFGSLESPRVLEILAYDNGTATGTAEGLVGSSGDNMGILDRIVQQAEDGPCPP